MCLFLWACPSLTFLRSTEQRPLWHFSEIERRRDERRLEKETYHNTHEAPLAGRQPWQMGEFSSWGLPWKPASALTASFSSLHKPEMEGLHTVCRGVLRGQQEPLACCLWLIVVAQQVSVIRFATHFPGFSLRDGELCVNPAVIANGGFVYTWSVSVPDRKCATTSGNRKRCIYIYHASSFLLPPLLSVLLCVYIFPSIPLNQKMIIIFSSPLTLHLLPGQQPLSSIPFKSKWGKAPVCTKKGLTRCDSH